MIRLQNFDFLAPASLAEAAEALARGDGETRILAGGTDLVAGMKQNLSRPQRIVWLGRIADIRHIAFDPEHGLRIGAMCTLDEIGRNDDVRQFYPSLVEAARSVASPQIRNRATIGGNLCLSTRCVYYNQSEFWRESLGHCLKEGNGICHAAPELDRCAAVFCSDLAPLIIALGANVTLLRAGANRSIPLGQLYRSDGAGHLAMERSEVLTEVSIPYDRSVTARFAKLRRRKAIDFPLVNVGISLQNSDHGSRRRFRIVVGAIASAPVEMEEAASLLSDGDLTDERIDEAARLAAAAAQPIRNVDGGASYRRRMIKVLVERTLKDVLEEKEITTKAPRHEGREED